MHTQCEVQTFAFFFFNDTATTEIYTLSLHDALPICQRRCLQSRWHHPGDGQQRQYRPALELCHGRTDRKSTRLNSSHGYISYAVFCLKKKKNNYKRIHSLSRLMSHLSALPTSLVFYC